MKAITNTKLIMEDGIIFDGVLLFDNGIILAADSADKVTIPTDCDVIDAGGKYTAPGLIDIHCHGAGEYWFYQNPQACSEHFISHGVTTLLPTFYMNMSLEEMIEGAEVIRKESKSGVCRIMDGLYMEGPYMRNGGSFRNDFKWSHGIKTEEYEVLVDKLGGLPRIWAIDPALTGIEKFMAYVHEKTPQAIFALGHSGATAEQCRKIAKYGVKVQTHHGDSGKAPGLAQGTIGAGCDEYTLYNPDMYAELIVDETGIHVVPDRVKLVVKTKGVERMILITDSTITIEGYTNNEELGIAYGSDLNYDDEGRLAGSRLTLDNACRNLMKHTGYGLCHAIRMATANPAKLLGIDDKVGTLE
ncbi:MAG: amidohydrolase family protein, partial [Clostridiaceae bacterium]|nr:amidohydrolase family protein [Clostridiaceae bacterium]